jgi:hypothetical protein
MSQFQIKLIAPDNTERELLYDNQTSSLTWGDFSPVLEVKPKTFQFFMRCLMLIGRRCVSPHRPMR